LTAIGSEAERIGNTKRLIGRGRVSQEPRVHRNARRGSGRAVRSAIIGPVILIQALGGVKRRWRQAEGAGGVQAMTGPATWPKPGQGHDDPSATVNWIA
jgi:hypothetical protein